MFDDATFLADAERDALAEIKRRVSARCSIKNFILFGSKARGDFRPDSDVDILMVTSGKLDWRETDAIFGDVYEANLAHGTLFTAHTVSCEEWENGIGLPYKPNVQREGVQV